MSGNRYLSVEVESPLVLIGSGSPTVDTVDKSGSNCPDVNFHRKSHKMIEMDLVWGYFCFIS